MHNELVYDVIIIGSGAAGLCAALSLSKHGRIAVLSKSKLNEGSTLYAQGGIAAVLDEQDSLESHIADTLNAGAGLCDQEAVRHTVKNGKAAIDWLIEQGVNFSTIVDKTGSESYHLTREGGHSKRRIIHAADATGMAVQNTLVASVLEEPNVDLYEYYNAIDLIRVEGGNRCSGLYALDCKTGKVHTFRARFIVLATGGASKVYLYTSNPDIASGDGIAMAWRAGCKVANLEFNQFHPTCLYHPKAQSFLITEAIRGEGGILVRPDGSRFMDDFSPLGELAPRDVVARAIDHEIKRLGVRCMYLDISHKSDQFVKTHFPNIYKKCLSVGIDITEQPIPVVPAAHYTCGGVVVDLNGKTNLDNVYAIGESSSTGLHGANRMASNSLLECVVFAKSSALSIINAWEQFEHVDDLPQWDFSKTINSDEEIVVTHNWHELRRTMWDYVGIVRTDKRLQRAKRRVRLLQEEIDEYYQNFKVTNDLLELRNLVLVSELIVESAIRRKESRGLHYTLDYPDLQEPAIDTVLDPATLSLTR
ncbi:MAG: L-aspartate oxidase [Pseudomonadota bacterium]